MHCPSSNVHMLVVYYMKNMIFKNGVNRSLIVLVVRVVNKPTATKKYCNLFI